MFRNVVITIFVLHEMRIKYSLSYMIREDILVSVDIIQI